MSRFVRRRRARSRSCSRPGAAVGRVGRWASELWGGSGCREAVAEVAPDPVDRLGLQRAGSAGELRYWLWPVDDDLADAQLGEDRQTVDVGETERAAEVDLILTGAAQRGSHELDLALHARDQSSLVASSDHQDRAARAEQSTHAIDADLPAMSLGVDHGHATGSDREVVDVRVAVSGAAPVVQQLDLVPLQVFGEARPGTDLAVAALLPGLCGLGLVDHAGE